jgi:hypothetical protein
MAVVVVVVVVVLELDDEEPDDDDDEGKVKAVGEPVGDPLGGFAQ